MPADLVEAAWSSGRIDTLELLLRAQVETLWRLWLDLAERRSPGAIA